MASTFDVAPASVTNELRAIIATQLSQFDRIQKYRAFIARITLAGLNVAPYTFGSGAGSDAQLIWDASSDLENLRLVWNGLMYVASGATVNSGVPTANDATHFGYPFNLTPTKVAGLGY